MAKTNDLVAIALAKHFENAAKAAKTKLKPGDHHVNRRLVIDVTGTVSRLADTDYAPTADIPLIPTLALLLRRAGFQRDAAKAILIDVLTEAMNADEDTRAALEREPGVVEAIGHVREITAALPRKPKQGATKVAVTVNVEEADAVLA